MSFENILDFEDDFLWNSESWDIEEFEILYSNPLSPINEMGGDYIGSEISSSPYQCPTSQIEKSMNIPDVHPNIPNIPNINPQKKMNKRKQKDSQKEIVESKKKAKQEYIGAHKFIFLDKAKPPNLDYNVILEYNQELINSLNCPHQYMSSYHLTCHAEKRKKKNIGTKIQTAKENQIHIFKLSNYIKEEGVDSFVDFHSFMQTLPGTGYTIDLLNYTDLINCKPRIHKNLDLQEIDFVTMSFHLVDFILFEKHNKQCTRRKRNKNQSNNQLINN